MCVYDYSGHWFIIVLSAHLYLLTKAISPPCITTSDEICARARPLGAYNYDLPAEPAAYHAFITPTTTTSTFKKNDPTESIVQLLCCLCFPAAPVPRIWPITVLGGGEQDGLQTQPEWGWQQAAPTEMGSHLWTRTSLPCRAVRGPGSCCCCRISLFFSPLLFRLKAYLFFIFPRGCLQRNARIPRLRTCSGLTCTEVVRK